MNNDVDH